MDSDMTDRIISLDAAIEAVRREGLSTGGEHAVVYVQDIIEALSALPVVDRHKSNMELLKAELYGDAKTAVSDIKFTKGDRDDVSVEEIAGMVLAAIKNIQNGGGRSVDLTF